MANVAVCRNSENWQNIIVLEISTLTREATVKVENEWGKPMLSITHLVFCSPSIRVTTPDNHVTRLLGVGPSVKHLSYQRGCFDSKIVLRCFKDFCNNNRGLHVLVVSSELTPVRSGGLNVGTTLRRTTAAPEVEDLQAKLKAAHKKAEADRILLRLKTAEADILRSELRLPRDGKPET